MTVFLLWAGALLLNVFAAVLAPSIRHDGTVGVEQIEPLVPSIVGLYIPALSCLAGFWFPKEERDNAAVKLLDRERGRLAIGLTAGYLAIVLLLVFWPIYITSYDTASLEPIKGTDLASRVANGLKIATMLSPLALAPTHYLTGAKTSDVAA